METGMQTHSNTILITGGGSGIGRGLAEAFHRAGNQVVIGGRRHAVLKETCEANPGMGHVVMDVADAGSIRSAARHAIMKYPELNCVINNAGLQKAHDFTADIDDAGVTEEIETNFLGMVRVCAA